MQQITDLIYRNSDSGYGYICHTPISLRKQIKGVVFRAFGPLLKQIIKVDDHFEYNGIQ